MLNPIRRLIDRPPFRLITDGPSQPIADPRQIPATPEGSGSFGEWGTDPHGLPAYTYEMDQHRDRRAAFRNSLGLDRRDHWYALGNDRLTALAGNDGTIQVFLADRGPVLLNRFDDGAGPDDWIDGLPLLPGWLKRLLRRITAALRERRLTDLLDRWQATHPTDTNKAQLAKEIQATMRADGRTTVRNPDAHIHFAGGFGYLDDGAETWATAYRYRPKGAETRRLFGVGYFETEMTHRGVRMVRRVSAPFGNDPLLISDIYLRNTTAAPVTVRHYEYWDVNIHQLKASWFETGLPALAATDSREAINESFRETVEWDSATSTLRANLTAVETRIPGESDPSSVDYYPNDVFLIDLSGKADAIYTDKSEFFGKDADPAKPATVLARGGSRLREASSAFNQPFCMVQRRDVTIQPGEIAQLRYAYGAVRPGAALDYVQKYRTTSLEASLDQWKQHLAYFSTGGVPALTREMAWHSYALQANTIYSEFFKAHTIAQGSAYLYLHGFDGVPRDQALFAVPVTYLRPALAKEIIRMLLAMRKTPADALTYAYTGHGVLDTAGIHSKPSDLDLFALLAITEYIAATGDLAFLDEQVAYYPATNTRGTILEHIRVAFDFLVDDIGFGDNGLIRVGDGDWADGVVFENAAQRLFLGVSYDLSVQHGESIPNSQMALYVLRICANMVQERDHDLAQRMRGILPDLQEAVAAQWNGRWYNRAILRDAVNQQVLIGQYNINLEAQPWALISGLATEAGHEEALINSIQTLLEANSPTGAPYLEHNGQVSAAIGQLLTWGYTRTRPDLAWQSFLKQSYANHALHFPDVWFGIWTGPDSLNPADDSTYPGGTWASPVTPMTDFPAMNSNPHAMALLALIRLAGLEPFADGLGIAPRIPKEAWVLDLPLIKVTVAPDGITGEYRPVNDGARTLYIEIPPDRMAQSANIRGDVLEPETFGGRVLLRLAFRAGERVPFGVKWAQVAARRVVNPVQQIRL